MDKVAIWNDILSFVRFLLYAYSLTFISYYKYCLNQRKRGIEYSQMPSIFYLAMFLLFAAFIVYLTKIAYDRFCISISNNGLLFIPVAIIPLSAILFSTLLHFRRYLIRSTNIYFIDPDQMVAMLQKVLNDMGWKDIRVSQTAQGQTTFFEPDKKYIVQTRSDQLKHTVTVRPIEKKRKVKTLRENLRKLLLREQANSTYPIDQGMVSLFKKKYLWLYILSWFSLCLCIYLLIFH